MYFFDTELYTLVKQYLKEAYSRSRRLGRGCAKVGSALTFCSYGTNSKLAFNCEDMNSYTGFAQLLPFHLENVRRQTDKEGYTVQCSEGSQQIQDDNRKLLHPLVFAQVSTVNFSKNLCRKQKTGNADFDEKAADEQLLVSGKKV